jgi:hypothetical protein
MQTLEDICKHSMQQKVLWSVKPYYCCILCGKWIKEGDKECLKTMTIHQKNGGS